LGKNHSWSCWKSQTLAGVDSGTPLGWNCGIDRIYLDTTKRRFILPRQLFVCLPLKKWTTQVSCEY